MKFKLNIFVYLLVVYFVSISPTRGQLLNYLSNAGNQFFNAISLPVQYQSVTPSQQGIQSQQQITSSGNCRNYFSYRSSIFGFGSMSGHLEIPNLVQMQNEVRAVLTVASKLTVECE